MKSKLTVMVVLILVFSMLSSLCISVSASILEYTVSGRGIQDNTVYYIINTNNYTHRYLAPENTDSTVYGSLEYLTGNEVVIGDARIEWKIEKQSDGTFQIKAFGGSDLYLSAFEGTQTGSYIKTHYVQHDDFVNFDIRRMDIGARQGQYVIMIDGKYATLTNTGVKLMDDASGMSYWSFVEVNRGSAKYLYNSQFNTNDIIYNVVTNCFYWKYVPVGNENVSSASNVLNVMKQNDITIYAGAGEAGALLIDPTAQSGGKILADNELDDVAQESISSLYHNALANSRCIIYMSSFSGSNALGYDGEYYNLVDETYDKGAHFVIGFKVEVNRTFASAWLQSFIESVDLGLTINEAVEDANIATGLASNPNTYIYALGDGTQRLRFPDVET